MKIKKKLVNSYWQVQGANHYYAVSPVISQLWLEFDNETLIHIFGLSDQNTSSVLLFDSSRGAYILLAAGPAPPPGPSSSSPPGIAQFSSSRNTGFYTIYNGSWVPSKCYKNNFFLLIDLFNNNKLKYRSTE